jgi:threonine/homoserine/homoserine lactone efflux protein
MDAVIQLSGLAGTAFLVGFSGAMMPGPLLVVTIAESTRRGWVAGPLIVLGHAILEAALVAAVVLGLSRFLTHPVTIIGMSLVGGIVMAWAGRSMLRSARTLTWGQATRSNLALHPVVAGIVVSLSNPYWTIWWATIGLTYLMIGLQFGTAGVLAFLAGHLLADLTWYSLVSTGVANGRHLLSEATYRRMAALCAVAVMGFGFWFLASGVSALWSRICA